MGLSGSLADMPLQDILQVVHHAKKSGTLHVVAPGGDGSIAFCDGKIVQAFSPKGRVDIGKSLLAAGRIDEKVLERAVALQAATAGEKRLGAILVEDGAVNFDDIEEVVKGQIRNAVSVLLSLRQGSFNLILEEVPHYDSIAVALDELAFTRGLDTQHLLLQALKSWDERGGSEETVPDSPQPDDSTVLEGESPASAAVPSLEEEAGAPRESVGADDEAPPAFPVLLVSLDGLLSAILSSRLEEAGFQPESLESDGAILDSLKLMKGGDPVIVIDFDEREPQLTAFVEQFVEAYPSLSVVALRAAEPTRLYSMGVRAVLSGDGEDLAALLESLLQGIRRRRQFVAKEETSPVVREFRRFVGDLVAQRGSASMALSLLRVVSHRFERAVLFYIAGPHLVPLGAFGQTPDGRGIPTLVHEMHLRLEGGSPLETIVDCGDPLQVGVEGSGLVLGFLDTIGVPANGQACIMPLSASGRPVALLYCDQGEESRQIGELDSFLPLLRQAGESLEEALEQAHRAAAKAP